MRWVAAIAIVGMFALAACEEGAGTSASAAAKGAAPKQAGQMCALSVAQCQSFAKREGAMLPILNKPRSERNPIDDQTVKLVLDTFVSSQAVADKTCTPVTGKLTRKARMLSKSGKSATLMGRGSDVCTLVQEN